MRTKASSPKEDESFNIKYLRVRKRFNKLYFLGFIVFFAAISGYLVIRSFAITSPTGDLNNDGKVDIVDLSILLSNYGTTNASADINNDGTVNVFDLSILLSKYGTTTSQTSGFVQRSGSNLTLNGQPFQFTGFNFYNANSKGNCAYSGNLNDMSNWTPGIEVMRAWYFQKFTITNGTRDWSKFDASLAAAKAHGIKVIPALGDEWDFGCDSTGQKTLAWYQTGYKNIDANTDGGNYLTSYRQFAIDFANRYKDDPTIAIIQLMNEPDGRTGSGCDETAAISALTGFTNDVADAMRAVDPNHIIMLGSQGQGQCGERGGDYQTVMNASGNQVCEYHDYNPPNVPIGGDSTNGEQVRINQCNTIGKPLIIGEAGIQQTDVSSLQERANDFAAKIDATFSQGVDGFAVWNWWNCSVSTSDQWKVCPGDPTIGVLQSR
jgi:mannan endo-1,4-beta-mannosidase